MSLPNFWDDGLQANKAVRELKGLKNVVEPFEKATATLTELKEFSEIADEDTSLLTQINNDLMILTKIIDELEVQTLLSGELDHNNALVSINAGAGGTESCDWANMLLRMYTRWADDKKFKVEVLDILAGESAGIKNATLRIEGDMAYGLLKSEKGV
ncbi:MAG: PCRF domain-containing protein, partial [Candidatus Omnitrophica bacterium]|nr:PCRF domain-containing protein [Candidatus Omnitrophota bacterium]